MKIIVQITPRRDILDPQGQAVLNVLHGTGFSNISNVRVGKLVELEIDTTDKQQAVASARVMAEKLLANPVIEDFTVIEPIT